MSEISNTHFTDNYQPSAAQLNTPARKGAADIALLLSQALALTSDAVLSGLDVNGVPTTMTVSVAAGAAIHIAAAPVSPGGFFEVVIQDLAAGVESSALSDVDGSLDLIDVISCRSAYNYSCAG